MSALRENRATVSDPQHLAIGCTSARRQCCPLTVVGCRPQRRLFLASITGPRTVQWSQDCRAAHFDAMVNGQRGLFGTQLVADLERTEGRPAQPFLLRITEIPVAGHELWQLRPDHVLVSAGLLRDTADFRRRLTPVVRALL